MFEHSNGIYIPHLSASTINSFITNRYGFYQSKVLRAPFEGNQYTAQGTAIEHGINVWIESGSDYMEFREKVGQVCLDKFLEEMAKTKVSKWDYEDFLTYIPKMAVFALDSFQPLCEAGKPVTQYKIETNLHGVERPIVGYLDFTFPGKRVRDTKVVSKSPSKLKQDYILQGALYRHAMQVPVSFEFFITNKAPTYKSIELSDDEFIHGLSYLTRAAQVIEEIEKCEDPKRLLQLMSFPNFDAMFNYNDKKKAADQWEIILK